MTLKIQHPFESAIADFTKNVTADLERVTRQNDALEVERAALIKARADCQAKLPLLEPRVALDESAALEFSAATLRVQNIAERLFFLDGEKAVCRWAGLDTLVGSIASHWIGQVPLVLSQHFLDTGICDDPYRALQLARMSDAFVILPKIVPFFTNSRAGIWDFLERVKRGQLHLGIDLPSSQASDASDGQPQPQRSTA